MFATSKNRQTSKFYIATNNIEDKDHIDCLGINSFSHSWNTTKLLFCNPPWQDIPKCIEKIKEDKTTKIILITPILSSAIKTIAIDKPIKINHQIDTFIPKRFQHNMTPIGKPPWKQTWAVLVSGKIQTINPTTKTDGRFIFQSRINNIPARTLVDSGCSVIAISKAFIDKHKIPVVAMPKMTFSFANNTANESSLGANITFQKGRYKVKMKCYVVNIVQDLIIGSPWFETVVVNVDWRSRSLQIIEKIQESRIYGSK